MRRAGMVQKLVRRKARFLSIDLSNSYSTAGTRFVLHAFTSFLFEFLSDEWL